MSIIPHGSHFGEKLRKEILARSVPDDWFNAKREWELTRVFFSPPGHPGTCLCGHPIRENCVLTNRLSGIEVTVGNVCVNQFLGLDSEELFAAVRKIIRSEEHTSEL